MWWMIVLGIVAGACGAGIIVAQRNARRWRALNWDNLHERGKLIAAQLAHLREVSGQVERPEMPVKKLRVIDAPKKQRLLWPRQATIPVVTPGVR